MAPPPSPTHAVSSSYSLLEGAEVDEEGQLALSFTLCPAGQLLSLFPIIRYSQSKRPLLWQVTVFT